MTKVTNFGDISVLNTWTPIVVQFQDCKSCFGPKYIIFRIASLAIANLPPKYTF